MRTEKKLGIFLSIYVVYNKKNFLPGPILRSRCCACRSGRQMKLKKKRMMTLPDGNPSSRLPRDASPGGGASDDEDGGGGGGCAFCGEAGGGEEEVAAAAAVVVVVVASYAAAAAAAAAAAPSGALPAAAEPSPRCSHPRRRGPPEISRKKDK